MYPRYLIIGQGIAGTLLSYALWKQNISFLVFDEPKDSPNASVAAGAVINPVNVNKWVMTEDHDHFFSFAVETYKSIEETLGIPLLEETTMLVFHKNQEERDQFESQQLLFPSFMQHPDPRDAASGERFFNYQYGIGRVAPVWKLRAAKLLAAWSQFLQERGLLVKEHFRVSDCQTEGGRIHYNGVHSEKIIFCEGAAAIRNPHFNHLPFTRNRGDALLISIPGLPPTYIYQQGIRLIHVAEDLFWCGSNYQWKFDNLQPDQEWRKQTEEKLRQWLKLSFKVEDHIVAERPTTAGQQFLAGVLCSDPAIAIFNGLGTKGFSCAPALAFDFCNRLTNPGQFSNLSQIG